MDNISVVSKHPLVLMHKDEIYGKLIKILKQKLQKINATPFEFTNNKGEKISEKYRYSYPIGEILSDPDIYSGIRNFATLIVPMFAKKLKSEINHEEYKLQRKDQLRYCLRVRIFEDREGYSLQPHKDSEDTILAFILQLDSNNANTSVYRKGRQFKLTGDFEKSADALNRQVAKVVNKICPGESIYIGESQFRKNVGLWTDNKFFRHELIDSWVGLQEFSEEIIETEYENIYALCNSLPGPIYSPKLESANELNYHGVRPIKQESRKLLLMDLIAQPTDDDVLIMSGVKTDTNSYYLIYGPEKCNEITGILQ